MGWRGGFGGRCCCLIGNEVVKVLVMEEDWGLFQGLDGAGFTGRCCERHPG